MLVWFSIALLLGFAAPAAAEAPASPFELLIEALHESGTLDDATFEAIRAAARQEAKRSLQTAPVGAAPGIASAAAHEGASADVAASSVESPSTGVAVSFGEDGLEVFFRSACHASSPDVAGEEDSNALLVVLRRRPYYATRNPRWIES